MKTSGFFLLSAKITRLMLPGHDGIMYQLADVLTLGFSDHFITDQLHGMHPKLQNTASIQYVTQQSEMRTHGCRSQDSAPQSRRSCPPG